MGISQLAYDELVVKSKQAIGNAIANEVIQQYLADWGYTAARLQAGQSLLDAAVRLSQVQAGEVGDQINATADKDQVWGEADLTYMRLLKVARVAVKKPGDRTKLALDGDRAQDYPGWLVQTYKFYDQALGNPDILKQLAEFNLTPAKLQAGRTLVEALEAAHTQQTDRIGAKQNATAEREAAVEALQKWMSDFLAIADVALEDHPQLLESLGVLVRSQSTSAPTTPPAPEPMEPTAS